MNIRLISLYNWFVGELTGFEPWRPHSVKASSLGDNLAECLAIREWSVPRIILLNAVELRHYSRSFWG